MANLKVTTDAVASPMRRSYGPAMAVISLVFFMWGFVTVLNDILVPHLKAIFDLNYTQIMLIQFTFFSAYFLVSMPAAKIISAIGYQRSIVLGLSVMAAGALLFIPAASLASYGVFLGALYVLASGMTILQVTANPYVAALGSPDKASSRLNLVQALNSLGTTVGPWFGGLLILSGATPVSRPASIDAVQLRSLRMLEASRVKLPYLGIALLLILLAAVIASFRFPVLEQIEKENHASANDSVWRHRQLVLGAIAIFLYVGAEVSIGSFLVNYFMQPSIGALQPEVAARYVSLYWGGAMVGRFAGSAVLRVVRTGPAVGAAAMSASLLVGISIFSSGPAAMWSILLVGLFNSILFPSIFTLGIAGLGAITGRGSAVLVAAIVGGAIIPVLQGALADRIGLQPAFIVPGICYLFIVFYGFIGSRPVRAA
jgi:FHS family L-fucose permease-like MFS transporter